jgi:hypothetical protein
LNAGFETTTRRTARQSRGASSAGFDVAAAAERDASQCSSMIAQSRDPQLVEEPQGSLRGIRSESRFHLAELSDFPEQRRFLGAPGGGLDARAGLGEGRCHTGRD